jgi:hypothetical protein
MWLLNQLSRGNSERRFTKYAELVEEYRNRKLSYDSDALFAFSGVMSRVASFYDGFVFGIPRDALLRALLWVLAKSDGSKRVVAATPRRNPKFPSWSWVGWSEQVSYRFAIYARAGRRQFVLGSAELEESPAQPGNSESGVVSKESHARNLVNDGPSRLRFAMSTECVDAGKFYTRRSQSTISLPNSTGSYRNAFNYCFRSIIFDASDKRCGVLFDNSIPPSNASNAARFEFILLLRASIVGEWFQSFARMNSMDNMERLLIVMLVEKKGEYVERLGIGQIDMNAWRRARPKQKHIVFG